MSQQYTLNAPFTLSGKGLHTGQSIHVEFTPAPENHGIQIERIDIAERPIIRAIAENVHDIRRGTILSVGSVQVSTVEHGLAALYALGVDNCHIRVDGPEFPILDGSSMPFVDNILRAGLCAQQAARRTLIIDRALTYTDEVTGTQLTIEPADEFSISTDISFDSDILGAQHAVLNHMSDFPQQIAAARTFVFVHEIEPLLNLGLIKGGDLDNAIVIYERPLPQDKFDHLTDLLGVPPMDAAQTGYIMHHPLTWDNEPARHKLLDIIGDMSLIGYFIQGHITARKPGHSINNQFARLIRREMLSEPI